MASLTLNTGGYGSVRLCMCDLIMSNVRNRLTRCLPQCCGLRLATRWLRQADSWKARIMCKPVPSEPSICSHRRIAGNPGDMWGFITRTPRLYDFSPVWAVQNQPTASDWWTLIYRVSLLCIQWNYTLAPRIFRRPRAVSYCRDLSDFLANV